MIAISLVSLGVAILLASITVLSVAATRAQPAPSVVCFAGNSPYTPGVDTLPMTSACEGTLAGDWHSVELTRLSDVEALLDRLEASNARTELEMTGNDRFTVRWR